MPACTKCSIPIPPERLAAIPETLTCVRCSDVSAIVGFMVFDHKTAPRLVTIPASNKEAVRQARRAFSRSR